MGLVLLLNNTPVSYSKQQEIMTTSTYDEDGGCKIMTYCTIICDSRSAVPKITTCSLSTLLMKLNVIADQRVRKADTVQDYQSFS